MARGLFALCLVSASFAGAARAEPCADETCAGRVATVPGPSFTYVPSVSGLAEAACTSRAIARAALYDVVEKVRKQTGQDAQIAILFAGDSLACDDLFYLPIANDVRGIGYQHQDERELFDDSPDSLLEGIVFLGDVVYWQSHRDEFARAFNHELGHRWGARVHVVHDQLVPGALLGREEQHWSYFVDSAGSALEGNRWLAGSEGSFTSATSLAEGAFSPLDLYLMGVLPAQEVPAFTLLVPAEDALGDDCKEQLVSSSSPPQWCGPKSVRATGLRLTIDDVIAAEGPREPLAFTPREVTASVIVLASGRARFDAERCAVFHASLQERFAAFAEASAGRLRLRNLSESDSDCSAFAAPTREPVAPDAGCQLVPGGPSAFSSWLWLAAIAWTRRRTHAPRKRASRRRECLRPAAQRTRGGRPGSARMSGSRDADG